MPHHVDAVYVVAGSHALWVGGYSGYGRWGRSSVSVWNNSLVVLDDG